MLTNWFQTSDIEKSLTEYELNKDKIDKVILLNDFQILSVIRNMKIIGIFERLATKDKKKTYLKLIPYAWQLIELRMQNNQIFDGLKRVLDINFPKKIRNLKWKLTLH